MPIRRGSERSASAGGEARVVGGREPEDAQMQQSHGQIASARTTGPYSPPGRSWNASGIDSAATNIAAMAPNIAMRTTALVGAHQVAEPGEADPAPPEQREHQEAAKHAVAVRSPEISAVTWVIAKTNTRSKKSSIGVTRASSETWRMRGCRDALTFSNGTYDDARRGPGGSFERMDGPVTSVGRSVGLTVLIALPLAGFALFVAVPSADVHWEDHPTHFALVLGVALVNVALGVVTSEARAAARRCAALPRLARAAGELGVPRAPCARDTGRGRLAQERRIPDRHARRIAARGLFAAWSAIDLDEIGMSVRRWQRPLRASIAFVLLAWAAASIARFSVLDHVPDEERATWVLVALPFGVAAYAFAGQRYVRLYLRRRRVLPLAVAVAFVLLAEALIAVGFSRAWHASWWEWHLLMAVAFGTIFVAARGEYRRERSIAATFGGIYLERTLERIDRRQSAALGRLTSALHRGESIEARGDGSSPTRLQRGRGRPFGARGARTGSRGRAAGAIRRTEAGGGAPPGARSVRARWTRDGALRPCSPT